MLDARLVGQGDSSLLERRDERTARRRSGSEPLHNQEGMRDPLNLTVIAEVGVSVLPLHLLHGIAAPATGKSGSVVDLMELGEITGLAFKVPILLIGE